MKTKSSLKAKKVAKKVTKKPVKALKSKPVSKPSRRRKPVAKPVENVADVQMPQPDLRWHIHVALMGGKEMSIEVVSSQDLEQCIAALESQADTLILFAGSFKMRPTHVSAYQVTGPVPAAVPAA